MMDVTAELAALLLFGFLFIFLILGIPIAFCTMLVCTLFLLLTGIRPLIAMAQTSLSGMGSFTLLAVPMFMLAGLIMEGGGISRRLINWVRCISGNVRGSVGIVTIIACALFAALTGSAPATVTAIGAIMLPALSDMGYKKSTATGMLAAGGCLGPIIPPSIPMLVYGSTTRLSIPALFLGGLLPGLFLTAAFLVVHQRFVNKNKDTIQVAGQQYTAREKWVMTWKALPALVMPVIILGGIYGGVFTPTESAAIAVLYATVMGFATRELTVKILIDKIIWTAVMGSAIAMTIGAGFIFTYLMGTTGLPVAMTKAIVPIIGSPTMFLVMFSVILFIAGCLLSPTIIIVLLAPILVPIGLAMGIDALHMGVAFCVNISIGNITPPFGANLNTAARIADVSYEDVVRGVIPYMVAAIVTTLIITFCPIITTGLPRLFGLWSSIR